LEPAQALLEAWYAVWYEQHGSPPRPRAGGGKRRQLRGRRGQQPHWHPHRAGARGERLLTAQTRTARNHTGAREGPKTDQANTLTRRGSQHRADSPHTERRGVCSSDK
jgi:hypothetical protein